MIQFVDFFTVEGLRIFINPHMVQAIVPANSGSLIVLNSTLTYNVVETYKDVVEALRYASQSSFVSMKQIEKHLGRLADNYA